MIITTFGGAAGAVRVTVRVRANAMRWRIMWNPGVGQYRRTAPRERAEPMRGRVRTWLWVASARSRGAVAGSLLRQQRLHPLHDVRIRGVVGEVLQLARVLLVVEQLHPALAAVPLGVPVLLRADGVAHEPRLALGRLLAGRRRGAAAHLREGRL